MFPPLYCEAWAAILAPDSAAGETWRDARRLGACAAESSIPAATRRRLGGFARTVICCGLGVLGNDDTDVVLSSRYGDLTLAHTLLNDIMAAIPPSPAGFSMSVHNAPAGVLDILRGSRAGPTAIAAGPDSLCAGLLEAWLRLRTNPGMKVVLIYTEQPPDAELRPFVEAGLAGTALALKLCAAPPAHPAMLFRPAQGMPPAQNIRSDLLARRLVATLEGAAPPPALAFKRPELDIGTACMTQRVDHAWRLFCTAVTFTIFGLGGLLLAVTAFPLLRVFVRDEEKRTDLARRLVHHSFRLHRQLLVALGIISFKARDTDCLKTDRGCIVVANHPSLLDIVLLISLTERAQCIVKAGVWRNPFMRSVVIATSYIRNDSDPGQIMAACAASLARGDNLIIFPEGTRTVLGTAPKFQRGVANIAIRLGAPIRLVTINCRPSFLRKGQKWYDVPPQRPRMTVTGHEKIDAKPFFANDASPAIASRRLTCYLNDQINERLRNE